jgi:hypothetical protein
MYNDNPVFVRSVDGPGGVVDLEDIRIHADQLPFRSGEPRMTFPLSDPLVDISNMRIGYANSTHDAVWCERFPNRGNTQGLNETNVQTTVLPRPDGDAPHYGIIDLCSGSSLIDMFKQNYPDVKHIVAKFDSTGRFGSAAFSRVFALSKDSFRGDYLIHYKGTPVAFGDIHNGVNLNKNYRHLKEQLVEYGINVAA